MPKNFCFYWAQIKTFFGWTSHPLYVFLQSFFAKQIALFDKANHQFWAIFLKHHYAPCFCLFHKHTPFGAQFAPFEWYVVQHLWHAVSKLYPFFPPQFLSIYAENLDKITIYDKNGFLHKKNWQNRQFFNAILIQQLSQRLRLFSFVQLLRP